jgi:hypothetical protein
MSLFEPVKAGLFLRPQPEACVARSSLAEFMM